MNLREMARYKVELNGHSVVVCPEGHFSDANDYAHAMGLFLRHINSPTEQGHIVMRGYAHSHGWVTIAEGRL